ncbi:MAG: hypothetical protein ACRDE8_07875 [Ginsengibacter sp.]
MNKIELIKKFNLISENIPKNEWKYFHRGSLSNFIYNIDEIKDTSKKEKTNQILFNCINDIELNFEPDSDYSIYLFNNYLGHIVPIYRNTLGFSVVPSKYALISCIIISIAVFILLLPNLIWEVIFCGIVILITYRDIVKFKMHKVYGFRY